MTDDPVLLAYDGSPGSATAIAVAGRLLRPRKALVCHVWNGLSKAIFNAQPAELPGALALAAADLDRAEEKAGARLAMDGVRLARAAGFDAVPLLERVERKTWRALLEVADETSAALIVAGSHGKSGLTRAVLGSVSTGLLHHARVPVLIVPPTASAETAEGPLLLGYDGSDEARHAIATAGSILRPHPALLLNLWQSWVAQAPAFAGLSRSVTGMATELDEIADEQSENRLAEGLELAEAAGVNATGLSERTLGTEWQAVLDAADEHAAGAIVLGSRGLTGISAALGSVTTGVVHHSHRPVLVVPPASGR